MLLTNNNGKKIQKNKKSLKANLSSAMIGSIAKIHSRAQRVWLSHEKYETAAWYFAYIFIRNGSGSAGEIRINNFPRNKNHHQPSCSKSILSRAINRLEKGCGMRRAGEISTLSRREIISYAI